MEQQTNWGGARSGTGPKTAIPAGDGEKTRITIALGDELLDKLRQRWPGLSEQDLVRAACWEAAGEPKV